MTWLDELSAAMQQVPAPGQMKVATVVEYTPGDTRTVTVTWEGCEPAPALWSAAFDLVVATKAKDIEGLKVLVLLTDGQPVISDLIIGS